MTAQASETRTILVVDDDEHDIALVRLMLGKTRDVHYDVRGVSSIETGLSALQAHCWDVCLVDYNLGSQTGIEFVREAGRLGTQSPFVLMSGAGNRDVDLAAMDAGVSGYLDKHDLGKDLLERTLRYAIASRRVIVSAPADSRSVIPHDARAAIHSLSEKGHPFVAAPFVLSRSNDLLKRYGAGNLKHALGVVEERIRKRLFDSDQLYRCEWPAFVMVSDSIHPQEARRYFSMPVFSLLIDLPTRSGSATVRLSVQGTVVSSEGKRAAADMVSEVNAFLHSHCDPAQPPAPEHAGSST